jgi:hypothetical protein
MAILHIQNLTKNPHHKDKKDRDHQTLARKNFARKTSNPWAAGAEEEDDEQADMTYMAGSTSFP